MKKFKLILKGLLGVAIMCGSLSFAEGLSLVDALFPVFCACIGASIAWRNFNKLNDCY